MKQELLRILQVMIKEMSVNSLTSVYPDQLLQWLNISQSDLIQFVEDLYLERLITYKYRFQCKCGNICTSYLRKLQREPYLCKECGQTYSIDIIKQKGILLYELDKKEILDYENENIDFKKEAFKEIKVVYMDRTKIVSERDEEKMEIFLGSSSDAKNDMRDIGYKLEQLKKKPLLWNEAGAGIFPPNKNTIDSLIDITKRVQAAVFIFNADDTIWHHNSLKENKTVRDNVLFEYGLFCGALGKSKVCFVCKGNPSLASDLNGVTYIDGNEGSITIGKKLEDWLNAM